MTLPPCHLLGRGGENGWRRPREPLVDVAADLAVSTPGMAAGTSRDDTLVGLERHRRRGSNLVDEARSEHCAGVAAENLVVGNHALPRRVGAEVTMSDRSKRARCIEHAIPANKPVARFTPAERALLRAPSVANHLNTIRCVLALNALVQSALAQTKDLGLSDGVMADAADALDKITADGWELATQLAEGLPAKVQNLAVVLPTDGGGE